MRNIVPIVTLNTVNLNLIDGDALSLFKRNEEAHMGHYLVTDGGHYLTSEGEYLMCKE